jgi:uncharacterized membrane protein YqaE (UPF0057 family)
MRMEKVKRGLRNAGSLLVELAVFLLAASVPIALFAAYVTHLVSTLVNSQYAFFFLGILLPPVAVINGFFVWAS